MAKKKETPYSKMTPEELNKELLELRREQFNLRMQKVSETPRPDLPKKIRRNIARIKTYLTQKLAGNEKR